MKKETTSSTRLLRLWAFCLVSATLLAFFTGCSQILSTNVPATPNEVANESAVEELPNDEPMGETEADLPIPSVVPWNLKLVRMEYPMAQADEPEELKDFRNGIQLDGRVLDEANAMFDAAKAAGLSPIAVSGFRSYQTQLRLFNNKVTREINNGLSEDKAFFSAKTVVALPGASEHQTGLAIDIVAESYQTLDEGVEDTDEIKWFYEHCTEYGFIVRYPNEKSSITGIVYEPWHFRYVGKEVAQYIRAQGITFEQYFQDHLTTEALNLVKVLD